METTQRQTAAHHSLPLPPAPVPLTLQQATGDWRNRKVEHRGKKKGKRRKRGEESGVEVEKEEVGIAK